ncbi:exodeoxyribonuclease VII large subunit [Amphibiibacter pelophylacis]|uniref:Exodeoxyribonuclease VII large subunit n=1 Tax=Amphibiibacter pelophylacis TaxID=1799477 RepID=A0ACC6P3B1_9BURK
MRHYLQVPYAEKDAAKALGARWDAAQRRWYAPDGLNLDPFAAWLPTDSQNTLTELVPVVRETPGAYAAGDDLALPAVSLSRLLSGVAQAVAQAYRSGVWTTVEVLRVSPRNGHIYLELTERGPDDRQLAQARAVIWAGTASRILPSFEQATGASLAPGIKLLVQARPVFHAQYGFSLEIDAIDPRHTLGDLEARKREIRARLRQEGVFDANRQLAAPWDYQCVLVVAPPDAAGLGDFQAEAHRLEQHGLCHFVYAHSRFQGEGAAAGIRQVLLDALAALEAAGEKPDAVAIVRGGGAVNDLAWLNELALSRTLCTLSVPVLTGIGHERDQTTLDEVAHTAYDTPSKVIAGIEARIVQRAREAQTFFETVSAQARQSCSTASSTSTQLRHSVQASAQQQLGLSRQLSQQALHSVDRQARSAVAGARVSGTHLLHSVRSAAPDTVALARTQSRALHEDLLQASRFSVERSRSDIHILKPDILWSAQRCLAQARSEATALMREVAGQGPEKTLNRGFALVRDAQGRPVTSRHAARAQKHLHLQFHDGPQLAHVEPDAS